MTDLSGLLSLDREEYHEDYQIIIELCNDLDMGSTARLTDAAAKAAHSSL